MKNKFQKTLKHIEDKRAENLQKFINLSYNKLNDLKKYYYDWYKDAEESGYKESAIVNQKYYNVIVESIKIKQWNDEQNGLTAEEINIVEGK